jgi:hypothetical protein
MMRRFHLQRHVDSTGTSGVGRVAEGIQFSSGWVALTWMSAYTTVAVYANIEVVQHLHGHGGNTKVVWEDAPLYIAELMEPAQVRG